MLTPRELRDMLLDTLLHRPTEAEYRNAVKWMDGDRLLFEIQYPASFCKLSGDYFGKDIMNRNQLGIILQQCVDHHLLNKVGAVEYQYSFIKDTHVQAELAKIG
ncbi:hypothetical protein B9Z55_016061 [Caenorhabditis nigoni]|nr:hypothetical protein B9Z55_016061 [Caenorhabditis nigoni]